MKDREGGSLLVARGSWLLVVLAGAPAQAGAASAEAFPTRPVRVVVPAVTHAVTFTDESVPAGFALQLP